jgi:hypothetical protein
VGVLLGYSASVRRAGELRTERQYAQTVLRSYGFQNETTLRKLYPDPNIVKQRARVLQDYGYSVFSASAPARPADRCDNATLFHVDAINALPITGPVTIRKRDTPNVQVTGWVVDGRSNAPAKRADLLIDNTIDIPLTTGLDRPDVARAYHNGGFEQSGFEGVFSTAILGDGTHQLWLKVIGNNDNLYCLAPATVSIRVSE